MATDEEYLDSLLKSMTENEQQSRNMEEVMKTMNMEVEEKEAFSLSPDDLADMLDMIEEKEELQPVIEEIQDEVSNLGLDLVDVPEFRDTEEVASDNIMADEDFIRRMIAQQEALEAEAAGESNEVVSEEVITDAAIEESVSEDAGTESDSAQEEDWKFDLDALLQASGEEEAVDDNADVDLMSLLTGENKEWDEVDNPVSQENYDNMDVTELIDSMDEAQNDLLEINDLLKKADGNEYVEVDNEDMLALLGGMQEEVSEENFFWENEQAGEDTDETESHQEEGAAPKGKKKKKRNNDKKGLFGKKDKKTKTVDRESNIENGASEEGASLPEDSKKEKKQGRLTQFFTYITQEAEEENTDENAEILKELEREDKQKAKEKKKAKKGKKKKENDPVKEQKKAEKDAAKAAKKQEKRQKQEQKRQEKLKNASAESSKKVLSKKGRIVLVAFCASVVAAVFALSTFLPDYVDKNQAREAFYIGDYETVYKLLYGKQLNDSDRLLFERVETILLLQRKLDSYQNNKAMERDVKALDALLLGVQRYHELDNVDAIGARAEVDLIYNQICGILLNNYGLSQENVLEILEYDEFEYTRTIYNLVEGKGFSQTEEVTVQEAPKAPQDVLPEEEEIINLN